VVLGPCPTAAVGLGAVDKHGWDFVPERDFGCRGGSGGDIRPSRGLASATAGGGGAVAIPRAGLLLPVDAVQRVRGGL